MAAFRMFVPTLGVIALAVGLRSLKGAAAGVEVVRVAVAGGNAAGNAGGGVGIASAIGGGHGGGRGVAAGRGDTERQLGRELRGEQLAYATPEAPFSGRRSATRRRVSTRQSQ